ncbi:hypothetical protein ACFLY0_02090 [Patescibacteria group bacterium]
MHHRHRLTKTCIDANIATANLTTAIGLTRDTGTIGLPAPSATCA